MVDCSEVVGVLEKSCVAEDAKEAESCYCWDNDNSDVVGVC